LHVVGRVVVFVVELGLELPLLLRFRLLALELLGAALLRLLLFLPPLLVPGRVLEVDAAEVGHRRSRGAALLGSLVWRGGARGAALRCGATAVSLAAAARRPVRR